MCLEQILHAYESYKTLSDTLWECALGQREGSGRVGLGDERQGVATCAHRPLLYHPLFTRLAARRSPLYFIPLLYRLALPAPVVYLI